MKTSTVRSFYVAIGILLITGFSYGQQPALLLSDALSNGIANYQSIHAKRNYFNSSKELVQNARNEYLPNIIGGLQAAYGTANGQYGALGPGSVPGLSASGPFMATQSWNAAFGSQYVINANWEVFTFGRLKSRINFAQSQANTDSADLMQEQFIQGVKIADAYLDLLIAQRLINNAKANLERATGVQTVVLAKAKSGLIAGVDSSIANAQVSNARIAVIDAVGREQERRNQLAQLMNDASRAYVLDTSFFFKKIPADFYTDTLPERNAQVQFYKARIEQSDKQAKWLKKSILPGLNLFSILQTRGSGFNSDYSPAYNSSYSKGILDGISPTRSNYVAGVSVAWNIVSIAKIKHQVAAQNFITKGYTDEYNLVATQLKSQLALADERIENTLQRFREVPVQYKAASDAYVQKSVLYKNGLTDIVDLQQALFTLSRAETDVSISYINVWQALLLKAAASGDFDLFVRQVR